MPQPPKESIHILIKEQARSQDSKNFFSAHNRLEFLLADSGIHKLFGKHVLNKITCQNGHEEEKRWHFGKQLNLSMTYGE